jgi:hypothetical protein
MTVRSAAALIRRAPAGGVRVSRWLRASLLALADLLRDIVGLLDFLDLLNLAGKGILRINIKALTLAILFYLGFNRLWLWMFDAPAIDPGTVTTVTVWLAFVAVFGGILLVATSVAIRGARLSSAQAYLLNLTEVRKRSSYLTLARDLWRFVFCEEARVALPLAERRARERDVRGLLAALEREPYRGRVACPGAPDGGALMDAREADALARVRERGLYFTRAGFLFVAATVLRYPVPPHLYRRFSGLDFARVDDWFDGGYFDVSDDRLAHQFASSRVLASARRRVCLPAAVKLRLAVGGAIRRMWFLLVSRSFAIHAARLLDELNRDLKPLAGAVPVEFAAPGPYFSALHLLWPTVESEREIAEIFGQAGSEAIAAARRRLVTAVFGREPGSAARVVDRMFVPNWVRAYEVRKRYDADWIEHLARTGLAELSFLGLAPARLAAERRDVGQRAARLARFRAALASPPLRGLAPDAETERALAVAYLAGSKGLRDAADAVIDAGGDPEALRSRCALVVAHRGRITHALRELRIHHLLCREQILNYRRQLEELLAAGRVDDSRAATREIPAWQTSSTGSSASSTT